MKYSNYKCPVCNNQFTEDDDVVVCPECGTPHHRECYIQNENCANADKHGTNEPIEVEFVDVEEKEEKISETETTENNTENPQQVVQEVIEELKGGTGDYMLNGKHVSFYEAAIGKNQKFYIPHFMIMDKTKKAVSWNIAGFFVPLAWCLYRKMYKFSAIILALYVLMIGTIGLTIMSNEEFVNAINECAEEDPNFYENILLYNTKNSNVSLTEKQMKLNKLSNEYKPPVPVQIMTYLITYGIRIIMGIYATNLYYKKLSKSIEKVDKLDISPDMKRSVLFRKCGTLPFILVAIIGFFEWQMF
ncbi:MAG: DUF2628 domain-containing protein [Ruminococcaceae bacterium]|nr:DUF2628 domain-containing protein [Oscillospiraceae bacterium]